MKYCIKLGILGFFIGLLFAAVPDENTYTIQSNQLQFSTTQTCVISQADSNTNAGIIYIARTKALCDNIDLSYHKDNKLRYLYPIVINDKTRCAENKLPLKYTFKATPTPSHPVSYYVFGLRKIVI